MGSRSRTRTSSTSSGTATTTPNVPSWIQGPYSAYFGEVGGMVGQNPTGVGASPLQQQAWQGASQLGSSSLFGQAADATRSLLDYTPGSVSAGQLRDTDLSAYMNPYTNEVIDRSMADLNRYRQMAIADTQGAATRSGAYGGSRHGVADSLTNERFIDQAGNLSASLRQAGWNNAMGAAQFDIANRFGADQFNVNSGLEGARQRLAAAAQLGGLGSAVGNDTRANVAMQAAMGADQQANDPVQARLRYLQQLGAMLGVNPDMFTGQTINQSGQSSGTTRTSSGGFSFGWSPSTGLSFGFG